LRTKYTKLCKSLKEFFPHYFVFISITKMPIPIVEIGIELFRRTIISSKGIFSFGGMSSFPIARSTCKNKLRSEFRSR